MGLFNLFGGRKEEKQKIPSEIKAQLDSLRQTHPELRCLSDERLMEMIQQAVEAEIMAQASAPDVGDIARMSAIEFRLKCRAIGEQLLDAGRWQEAERWLLAMLERAEKVGDLMVQCQATGLLGHLCQSRGDFPQAMALQQQSLRLAERLGNRRLQGANYADMGGTYWMQGQYPQAIEHYRKSLEIAEKNGDEQMQAYVYGNLGNVYHWTLAIE